MKLFITDLDFTLLNSKKEISENNLTALKRLEDNNIKFAFASGRSYYNICEIRDKYELVCPIIGLNGAQIISEKGEVISKVLLSLEDILPIISFCEEHNLIYRIFTDTLTYINETENLIYELFDLAKSKHDDSSDIQLGAQIYYDSLFKKSVKMDNLKSYLEKNNPEIYKMEITTSKLDLLKEAKDLANKNTSINVTSSYSLNLEITKQSIDKGHAINVLSEFMKINIKDVVAIGDGLNDRTMIEEAGIGIAMENAVDKVKSVSDYVTKNYEDDGVAHIINKLLEK